MTGNANVGDVSVTVDVLQIVAMSLRLSSGCRVPTSSARSSISPGWTSPGGPSSASWATGGLTACIPTTCRPV